MKTIRQIADEIGVSKQAVAKRMKKEPLTTKLTPFVVTTANGQQIKDEGIALIYADFAANRQPQIVANRQPKTANPDNQVVSILQEQVAFLQEQLTAKDVQLSEKDKQISNLTETVKAQAQSINADRHAELVGTVNRQLTATDEQPDTDEHDNENLDITVVKHENKIKRGFFSFFNRKT